MRASRRLVCALVLGKRIGYGKEPMAPHNLTLTVIGASLLWVGWFGFNAGSAVAADGRAGMAMVVTQLATAVAALAWMFTEWVAKGKPSVLGIASGAVAGLVAITPASGFVGVTGAFVIGIAAGVLCFFAATTRQESLRLRRLARCLRRALHRRHRRRAADRRVQRQGDQRRGRQPDGAAGAVVTTLVYSGVGSFIILKVIDMVIGLRVSEEEEREGLDVSLHGERVE